MTTDTKIVLAVTGSMLAGLLIATVLPPRPSRDVIIDASGPPPENATALADAAPENPTALADCGIGEPHGLGRPGAREPHDLGQSETRAPGVLIRLAARPGHATRPAAQLGEQIAEPGEPRGDGGPRRRMAGRTDFRPRSTKTPRRRACW